MPEHETTNFKLPYPDGTGKVKLGAVDFEELAKAADKKFVGLTATGTGPAFLSWGSISEAGALEVSSGDFTIAKLGIGEYEVKWTKEKTTAKYTITLGIHESMRAGGVAGYSSVNVRGFLINCSLPNVEGRQEPHSCSLSFQVLATS